MKSPRMGWITVLLLMLGPAALAVAQVSIQDTRTVSGARIVLHSHKDISSGSKIKFSDLDLSGSLIEDLIASDGSLIPAVRIVGQAGDYAFAYYPDASSTYPAFTIDNGDGLPNGPQEYFFWPDGGVGDPGSFYYNLSSPAGLSHVVNSLLPNYGTNDVATLVGWQAPLGGGLPAAGTLLTGAASDSAMNALLIGTNNHVLTSNGTRPIWTANTGTGSVVRATSPALVTPTLGTPASGTLTSCTGLPLTTGITGTLAVANGGTGVTSSTGTTNVVLSGSPTIVTPTIASFTNATHNHSNAAGGGQLTSAAFSSLASASVSLTAQTADIGTTTLTSTAGSYIVQIYIACSTLDAAAGTVTVTTGWTDDAGATTLATARALTSLSRGGANNVVVLTSGSLTYTVTHTGSYGSAQYALRIRVIGPL